MRQLTRYLETIPSSKASGEPTSSYESLQQEYRLQKIAQAEVELILEKYKDGASTRTIAVDLGRSRTAISNVLKKAGIEIRTLASPTREHVAEMKRLYVDERLSLEKVGEQVGFSTKTVLNHLRAEGVQTRSPQGV